MGGDNKNHDTNNSGKNKFSSMGSAQQEITIKTYYSLKNVEICYCILGFSITDD